VTLSVTAAASSPARRRSVRSTLVEARKLGAFFRRDLLVAWSYKLAFVADAVSLVLQAVVFSFMGKLIDPGRLPSFGGRPASYMEFVAIGIALGAFVQLGLGRVAFAVRQEQLLGTLEALLMTPTQVTTIQLGSVVYDLFFVPLRTAVFLTVVAATFGLHFHAGGFLPATAILLVFIPFVWGLGVLSAAGMLTFRRGGGGVAFVGIGLTLGSGAYFPISVLPSWVQGIARANPITTAVNGMRDVLIGSEGWTHAGGVCLRLAPAAAVSLAIGFLAFRLALRRERLRGTLGLY
jgi:ABC-2 type transport system permease protein